VSRENRNQPAALSNLTLQQAFELAVQHFQSGRLVEAEAIYRQMLQVAPNHSGALHHLGIIAFQTGRSDLGEQWVLRSLEVSPNDPAAHSNLGAAYSDMGRLDDAVRHYQRALELQPNFPEALNNLGNAWRLQGRLEEAIGAYQRAIELRPEFADAFNALGIARLEQGRLEEALVTFRRALELQPTQAEAHNNLGNALKETGRKDEAMAKYRRALELKPAYAEAWNNLGMIHKERGQLDEAAAAIERALALRPDSAEVHNNLGNIFKDQGRMDLAMPEYRRALEIQPNDARLHSNLIFCLYYNPAQDLDAIASEQGQWNRRFGEPAQQFIRPHTNERQPERRLRIGYVSADLRDHTAGWNLRPLFRHLDRAHFETFCYFGFLGEDEMTAEFRGWADHWRRTVGTSDDELADMIRQDEVDILVDLAQHTAGNRLPVFARQPAPVQVSFAGYPAGTGVRGIGWRLSDQWLEAEDCRAAILAAEKEGSSQDGRPTIEGRAERVLLLDTFWCYEPGDVALEVNALPALRNGYVTFGAFTNFCKVNDQVLRLWARVLRAAPAARLIMMTHPGGHRERTLTLLEGEGVEAGRVEFVGPRPRTEYLSLYHRVDVVLDPFPYNGHTTSLDGLWMGVPMVSLAGQSAVSRAGLSQLSNLGLPELVAYSEDEYVEIARKLTGDPARLAELRATLRGRMERSVLMDAPRWARSIEAAYRVMWREWCAA
jgi:predicted O-linked N-acetylglucosamine transferase (SPINDLY family)